MKKSILSYFIECVSVNYANFSGRARRMEYWSFVLINVVISMLISLLIGRNTDVGIILNGVVTLGLLIPGIAVAVRRMHDVGKSGWFILIPIYNLILALTEGDTGPNEYGVDPKNPELNSEIESIGTE